MLGDFPNAFREYAQKRLQYTETVPLISKDGKRRWIKTTLFPVHGDGRLAQLYFDDVTEGKNQFELALQAKQIAKIGSWKVDLVKNTLIWSNITKEIHEVPEDFVPDLETGINFYKEGPHREKIIEVVSECIQSGAPYDVELVIITANGYEKWVRAIGEAEKVKGKVVGLKGVFQDIDEIKRERLKNEKLDNRMRVAVQSANIGIWDWDVENNHLVWDENMFVIFGVDAQDFDGAYEAWEASVHPEDKERAAYEVQLALDDKKDFDTEFRILKKDGSVAYIQGRAQVFRNEKGQPLRMVGTNTDISRIMRKDERLRKLLETTENQNQKLVNFAHIVSHNLRSNSSNISMLSGMLQSKAAKGRTPEFLEMIQKSSERLEETIVQLNDIIKVQSTNRRDLKWIPVRPILDSVLESINALIEDSGAIVSIKVNQKLRVLGVKPYLTSIFINLLSNSIKYRSPKKMLKIEVSAENLGNQTVLTFKDNGLGVDLKKHGKNFFGMYKTFHGNKDAKGIGLFISKNQMEAMNGKIEVRSTVSKGSTFFLYFNNNQ